jgi:hypothetical protein
VIAVADQRHEARSHPYFRTKLDKDVGHQLWELTCDHCPWMETVDSLEKATRLIFEHNMLSTARRGTKPVKMIGLCIPSIKEYTASGGSKLYSVNCDVHQYVKRCEDYTVALEYVAIHLGTTTDRLVGYGQLPQFNTVEEADEWAEHQRLYGAF